MGKNVTKMLRSSLKENSNWFVDKIIQDVSVMGVDSNSLPKFTFEGEANVITYVCFRNSGLLEEIHAEKTEKEWNETNAQIVLDESSRLLSEWLLMRETLGEDNLNLYLYIVLQYETGVLHWEKQHCLVEELKHESDENPSKLTVLLRENCNWFKKYIADRLQPATIEVLKHSNRNVFPSINSEALVMSTVCFLDNVPKYMFEEKDSFTQEAMENLMIKSSNFIKEWLTMKDTLLSNDKESYYSTIVLELSKNVKYNLNFG